jgi:hypothetical protein
LIGFPLASRYKQINKVQAISIPIQAQQDHYLDLKGALRDMLKKSLVNLFTIAWVLLLFVPGVAIPVYLNNLDPDMFNSSPAVELYHFLEHGLTTFSVGSLVILLYGKNPAMRKAVFREIKDLYLAFKDRICK